MEKLTLFLEQKLMPLGERINRIKLLQVIRDSMMPLIPLIISGSMVLLLLNFPWIDKVVPVGILTELKNILVPLYNGTMSIISLFIAFLIGYNYSKLTNKDENPIFSGLISLVAFIIVTPSTITVGKESVGGVIPTDYLGSKGMFVAIIVGYLFAKLFVYLMNGKLKITLPEGVPPMVAKSFESLIPAFFTLVAVCIFNYIMTLTPFGNVHSVIGEMIQKPLLVIGTGLPALLISQGLSQLLWFFGLHGDNLVGAVMEPILTTAGMENLAAYESGKSLPYIITQQFASLFVVIAFISLVIAIVIVARSNRLKEVGKLSLLPACFCISEPIVFGLPIVMNVILVIPWVIVRPIFGLITYAFMYFGLCPAPTGVTLPWTTPPILSGFLATNSVMGAIVQIICIIVGVLIFIPFVKVLDNTYRKEESEKK